jgi:hypothetical protein
MIRGINDKRPVKDTLHRQNFVVVDAVEGNNPHVRYESYKMQHY